MRIRTKHLRYHVPVSLSISISSSICFGVLILFTCKEWQSEKCWVLWRLIICFERSKTQLLQKVSRCLIITPFIYKTLGTSLQIPTSPKRSEKRMIGREYHRAKGKNKYERYHMQTSWGVRENNGLADYKGFETPKEQFKGRGQGVMRVEWNQW